jgi:CRP-like cAMP-binding protein
VLKTRPRDLEDTLVRIVHEDDPVLAAAAVHFVARHQLWSLADDLQFLLEHRSDERLIVEAASWALALRSGAHATDAQQPRPVVELAHRMRTLTLFEFVSVDELFRIAGLGEEAHHPAGRELCSSGEVPPHVDFLIDGVARVPTAAGGERDVTAPAVLGLEEVLQGAPCAGVIRAVEPIVCIRVSADDFLTMVSDNVLLAQSLFSMLLSEDASDGFRRFTQPTGTPGHPLGQPIDRALALREHPLFARATPSLLLALVAAAREIRLVAGTTLFEADDAAAVFQVVDGELALERLQASGEPPLSGAPAPLSAGPGAAIGVAETLAGAGFGYRATVTRPGRAIRIDRDDLFASLTDHVDLMQGVFSEVLTVPRKDVAAAPLQA